MKTFLSLLFSALISGLQRWWNERRGQAARERAEQLNAALASVGEAKAVEARARKSAQGSPVPAAPSPGERRLDAETGRVLVWTGSQWRPLQPDEEFFNDDGYC